MKDWILESTRMRREGVTEKNMKEDKEVAQSLWSWDNEKAYKTGAKDEATLSGVGNSQL